jgi:Ca-activated chloride channel family protein
MKHLIHIAILFLSVNAFSQGGREYVRAGNKLYKENRFKDADSLYRMGMLDTASYKSIFNLGDALYKQGKYNEAADMFGAVAKKNQDLLVRAHAYHNLGNSYLGAKKYKESIEAYKNSLKLNPSDEDTRYNLAYAQKMLKKEEEQKKKDQDKKDNKDDKDKNKDKDKDKNKDQNKDQNKDKDKDKDQGKDKDKDKDKDQNGQKDKPQQQQMSKEDAQRMLDALNNDEKKVQDKLKKKNAKGVKVQVEKDW